MITVKAGPSGTGGYTHMTVLGIDVSSDQKFISAADWQTIANTGVGFVYIRAGVGNDAPDSHFANNVAGARAAGIVVGA